MTTGLRWKTLVTVALLGGVLGGCVVSDKPLFDASTAVTPAVSGRYKPNKNDETLFGVSSPGMLSLDGKYYTWKKDSGSDIKFLVFDIGSGLFVAVMEQPSTNLPTTYVLFKKTPVEFLYYEVVCQNIKKLGLPKKSRPVSTRIEKPVLQCIFDRQENMILALRLYARRFPPSARVVLAKP